MKNDTQLDQLFSLIFAHTVIKYDPDAGKKCLAAALESAVQAERERCAAKADERGTLTNANMTSFQILDNSYALTRSDEARKIAAAIRSGDA